MDTRVVVYAGPTVAPDEVRAVLPGAEVRPPAARGDLLTDEWRPGDVAVVIDGYFRERRSVNHKEILWLLREGARVVGAASMGALRAAELAPYGMSGVGEVYGMYATGEIDGDDEVGVVHGPADKGYPAQTVALVNLRYGAREGARAGLFPAAAGARVVAAAKELPFAYRAWADIEERVAAEDRDALDVLRRLIGTGEWDVKHRDALAALRAVRDGNVAAAGPVADGAAVIGITGTQLLIQRSRREYAPDRWMSDLDVLNAARLFDADYPRWHEEVLSGILTDLAAAEGLTLAEYGRAKLGVDGATPLPDRLAAWLTEGELARLAPADRTRLVMVRVWPTWQSADWRPAVLARLRESGNWPQWTDLVARADEVAEEHRYKLVVPQPAICARIFLRRWQQPGSSADVEMARRGYCGVEELGTAVRRFFAYDVRQARGAR